VGSSDVIFTATCQVTFSINSATHCGAAIYSLENYHVRFTGNSKVTFNNNVVHTNDIYLLNGSNIYSENYGCIYFEGNYTTNIV